MAEKDSCWAGATAATINEGENELLIPGGL